MNKRLKNFCVNIMLSLIVFFFLSFRYIPFSFSYDSSIPFLSYLCSRLDHVICRSARLFIFDLKATPSSIMREVISVNGMYTENNVFLLFPPILTQSDKLVVKSVTLAGNYILRNTEFVPTDFFKKV